MLGGTYLYSLSQKLGQLRASPILNSVFQKIDPTKKLSTQAMQLKGMDTAKLSEDEKEDAVCRLSLESIETLPINALIEDLKSEKISLRKDCLFKSKVDIKNLEGFPEVCLLKDKLADKIEISEECQQKLFLYKALRIHHSTISDNPKGLSTEILLQKFFGILTDQAFSTAAGVALFRQTSNELYERLPESVSAAKASIMGYLVDNALTDADQVKFDQSIAEARQKFPNDWEIYEIALVRKRIVDEDAFRFEILDYYSKQPESAIANYYMGCVQWSTGNITLAQNYFNDAVKYAPNDSRFKDTYENSLTKASSEQICTVKVNFNQEGF